MVIYMQISSCVVREELTSLVSCVLHGVSTLGVASKLDVVVLLFCRGVFSEEQFAR